MKQVTEQIKRAFENKKSLKVNNTRTDGTSVFLHGNEIIKRDKSGIVLFTFSGWPSVTTRERLRGILDLDVCQRKGEQYYNGAKVFDLNAWHVVQR
jgi:hypothetical protein